MIIISIYNIGLFHVFNYYIFNSQLYNWRFLLINFNAIFIYLTIYSFILYRQRSLTLQNNAFESFKNIIENILPKQPAIQINSSIKNIITIEDHQICIDELTYIMSDNVYQELFIENQNKKSKILIRCTLGQIETLLKEHPQFIRCHRSYIINSNYIETLEGNSRQQFFKIKNSNVKIPISCSFNDKILERFTSLAKW